MKKRLFVVDYRKDGEYRHHAIELGQLEDVTDSEIVEVCHKYVGSDTTLDSVIEVFADMDAAELNFISETPLCALFPMRPLYVNMDEVKKTRGMMGLTV